MAYWNSKKRRIFLEDDDSVKKLDEEILNSEAIPEVKLKWFIFEALNRLQVSKHRMVKLRLASRSIDRNNKADIAGDIVCLFDYIKNMMIVRMGELNQSAKNDEYIKQDKAMFEKIERLERGREYSVDTLLDMVDFLLRYLHLLHLTNLLRTEEDALESFKKSYS